MLISNILKHVRLTPEEQALFSTFWTPKTLEKGDYLLRNGAICRTDNYVVSGALKAFYINAETGATEILYFAIEGWWATDIESFRNQQPSIYDIQALKKTTLLQIDHRSFQKLLAAIPVLERYFRIILEGYTAALQRRIVFNNAHTARQRYADFLATYPEFPGRIPQYLIASYLGISAEFLSRIRRKNNSR
ncbi:Crp/Fnr family transcriptional regulator [Niabella beijingensis]|uniref:Crp/Fnr family transcriptional regulator n=1 Tax=Niabella beijingensis TaxID=2872700 RepID=UPI001CBF3359|nr:Crp/Fnr family transcriptional regulator [Niabella beijingensis]MBZ4187813.1 Crp/Fnr family transcriptional regulator [Niabella beijingensis]